MRSCEPAAPLCRALFDAVIRRLLDDLHVVDGDLRHPKLPLIPGHEIVGTVEAIGKDTRGFATGEQVGIPWLGHTCGGCAYCTSGRENLCDQPLFTGYTRDGGFATHVVADAAYTLPLKGYDDPNAANASTPLSPAPRARTTKIRCN